MKKFCVLCAVCCMASAPLFAFGKADDTEQKPLNNEWILCVTAFDLSALPAARRIAGDVIIRNMVNNLKLVSYRLRISPEYAFYEDYAWRQSLNTTAKAISAKRDERSLMLYRGDAGWKYRKNLKKVDMDIEKLEEEYAKKMAEKPLVNNEPSFALTQANIDGSYPDPPKPGTEYRFCQNQKYDAFLAGEIQEFHGRYFVQLRLYTLYTRTYIYEDEIIFSTEDTDLAVEEISARLAAVLSGNKPAAVAVFADPPDAQILINQTYTGRGTSGQRERPPGPIIVAVAADEYQPQSIETELVAGELTEITVNLGPLLYANVNINAPDDAGAAVYHGALYVGEAPLTLRLPIDQLNYIVVESAGGEMAKAIFTMPEMPGDLFDISLSLKMPPPSGQQRVNNARKWFYWAWGATWLAGLTYWAVDGIFLSQSSVLTQNSGPDFVSNTERYMYISYGALALFGVAVAHDVFQLSRYLFTATENAVPVVR